MDTARKILALYSLLLLISVLSSCNVVTAGDTSKSEEQTAEKDSSAPDDSSSQDDSKEKRSREEILFGNQQNKPNGLVDDFMAMADADDAADSSSDYGKKASTSEGNTIDMSSKAESDKETPLQAGDSNDMMMGSGTDNSWYNTVPIPSSALQYLSNAQLHTLPSSDFSNSLYDQADLYRRKRQLLAQPLPLRKRRSLRSSLGQMIQKRGIRMPRRSMRLKREVDIVDMGDLLKLLDRDISYEQHQIPGHFGSYPETPAPEFRLPFTFQHRGDGVLSSANEYEDNKGGNLDNEESDDLDNLMLLHPNARYIDTAPEIDMMPYRSRDEEAEAFQKWLLRHATPNILPVSRRSVPSFYPLDYRYIPGYKKRSVIFSNGNRVPNSFSGDNEDTESDFGKWGHVVQVPEAYASAEDVARLYGLANLMAEGDEESKMRRSV